MNISGLRTVIAMLVDGLPRFFHVSFTYRDPLRLVLPLLLNIEDIDDSADLIIWILNESRFASSFLGCQIAQKSLIYVSSE